MSETQNITAEDINNEKLGQVEQVITSLEEVAASIKLMATAKLGGHTLWLGGLPSSLTSIQQQAAFIAAQTREAFGFPALQVAGVE